MIQLSTIFKISISWLLLLLQALMVFSDLKIETRILGGSDATIEEVPFLVQIWRDGEFKCGGSRVSDSHIITAAHCVARRPPESFTIVAGASRLSDAGIRSEVTEIIIHPDYRKDRSADIAVMKLKSPIKSCLLGLAPICKVPICPGDEIKMYGWGKTAENASDFSNQLQTVTVRVKECELYYSGILNNSDNNICAALPGKDSCVGDSGGPGLIHGQLCGVTSRGIGCGRPRHPGVLVNVGNMLTFLSDVLRS